jgi:hypothetical protein
MLTPVHISRWLNGTFVSGAETSGRSGRKGLMRSRNRTVRARPPHASQRQSSSSRNSDNGLLQL